MNELYEVYVFCAFYAGVVIFSLWMTVADKVPVEQVVINRNKTNHRFPS